MTKTERIEEGSVSPMDRLTPLTHRQRACMLVLEAYSERSGGIYPTVREIAASMGLRSKSSVHRLLSALESLGFIRRLHDRQQAILILRPVSLFRVFAFDDATKELMELYNRGDLSIRQIAEKQKQTPPEMRAQAASSGSHPTTPELATQN